MTRKFSLNARQLRDALAAIDIHLSDRDVVTLGLPLGAPADGDDAVLRVYVEAATPATPETPRTMASMLKPSGVFTLGDEGGDEHVTDEDTFAAGGVAPPPLCDHRCGQRQSAKGERGVAYVFWCTPACKAAGRQLNQGKP